MNRSNSKNIISQLRDVDNRIHILSERSYDPELGNSDVKEITKRKKKLLKTKEKLEKKLSINRIETL
jgi:hypothetical protein